MAVISCTLDWCCRYGQCGYDFETFLIFEVQLLLGDAGALLEVHQVHVDRAIHQGEGGEETLVGARHRDPVEFRGVRLPVVLLAEVDNVCGLAHGFLQVPDHEVLALVDGEELAQPGRELHIGEL